MALYVFIGLAILLIIAVTYSFFLPNKNDEMTRIIDEKVKQEREIEEFKKNQKFS